METMVDDQKMGTDSTETESRRSFLRRGTTAGAVALGLGPASKSASASTTSEPASTSQYSTIQLGIDVSFDRMNAWAEDVNESHMPDDLLAPAWTVSSYVTDAGQPPIGRGVDKLAYTQAKSLGAGYVPSYTWAGHRVWTTGGAAQTANVSIAAFYYQGSSRIEMFESEQGGWGRNLLDLSLIDETASAEIARSRAWEHMDTSAAQTNAFQPPSDPQSGAPGMFVTAETGPVTLHPDRMYDIYFALTSEAVSTGLMIGGGETRPPNTIASQFVFIGVIGIDFM